MTGLAKLIILIIVLGILGTLLFVLYPNSQQKSSSPTGTGIEGKFCGGIAANLPENQCPSGYFCRLDGNYPDAGGKCVKK